MNDLLQFLAGVLPIIQDELDPKDPNKIGPKTSKYINDNLEKYDDPRPECPGTMDNPESH